MKKYLNLFIFLLFSAGISFARKQDEKIPRQVFTSVEQMPEFPGAPGDFNRFLSDHLRYPKKARKKNIQGKVQVRFIVEPDGRISNPEIIHSLDPYCDKETLRVIRKMPRWHPGRQNGAFVAVYYTIPVSFKLDE